MPNDMGVVGRALARQSRTTADPVGLMLADLRNRYDQEPTSENFKQLYADDGPIRPVFASLHERLNRHFDAINGRARTTHHYWAEPSRDLIELIAELTETRGMLRRARIEVAMRAEYESALRDIQIWLSPSGGSAVPDDFEPIEILRRGADR